MDVLRLICVWKVTMLLTSTVYLHMIICYPFTSNVYYLIIGIESETSAKKIGLKFSADME